LFNFLNKVSDSFLDKFQDLLEPYSEGFDNTPNITDDTDDDTETDDIDLENYEFPSVEYDGTPTLYEQWTDSNNVTWQYTHLTNEQAGITMNPNYLTTPPQYGWVIYEGI